MRECISIYFRWVWSADRVEQNRSTTDIEENTDNIVAHKTTRNTTAHSGSRLQNSEKPTLFQSSGVFALRSKSISSKSGEESRATDENALAGRERVFENPRGAPRVVRRGRIGRSNEGIGGTADVSSSASSFSLSSRVRFLGSSVKRG